MDEQAWLQKSEEILTDIKEWRRAHPKATFVEIEDEVHKRMMQLEAQVLQDADAEKVAVESGGERGVRNTRVAPPVGRVFFPLDEELTLLPGNLAPRQQEHLVQRAGLDALRLDRVCSNA